MTTYPYCRAMTGGDLVDTVKRLAGCKDCLLDIRLKGKWTGDGWLILADLVERYGAGPVDTCWQWVRLNSKSG